MEHVSMNLRLNLSRSERSSSMMTRVIVDELREIEAQQREMTATADADSLASRLLRRRCSLAVERQAHLVNLYLMLKLGYERLDLDELLL